MVDLHLYVPMGAGSAFNQDRQQLPAVMDELHRLLETALLVSPHDVFDCFQANMNLSTMESFLLQKDRSNRQELWMWLVNHAAHLPVPDTYVKRKSSTLTSLLPSSSGSQPQQLKAACRRLLRLVCEARPQQVCWLAVWACICTSLKSLSQQPATGGWPECSSWP